MEYTPEALFSIIINPKTGRVRKHKTLIKLIKKLNGKPHYHIKKETKTTLETSEGTYKAVYGFGYFVQKDAYVSEGDDIPQEWAKRLFNALYNTAA